jgi:two-component system, chemotaxis family, sensor kinase CheA
VPLHPLDRLLGFARPDDERVRRQIVILSTGSHLIGVHLDEVLRLEDLYLRELHPMLAALPAVAGTAVLGSGRAVLVLDAKGLLELSRPLTDKSVATGS